MHLRASELKSYNLQENRYCDCRIVTCSSTLGDTSLSDCAFVNAHRVILAAVSPFFDRSLALSESNETVQLFRVLRSQIQQPLALVDLSQFDQSSVEHLVSYIYCGNVAEGADKVTLMRMAVHCEMMPLYEHLTSNSVSPIKPELLPAAVLPQKGNTVNNEQSSTPPQQLEPHAQLLPTAPSSQPPSLIAALKRHLEDSPTSQLPEKLQCFRLNSSNGNGEMSALKQPLTIDTVGNHADSRFQPPNISTLPPSDYGYARSVRFECFC